MINQLRAEGLDIRVMSFDGKSHGRLVRDNKDDPATILEVMRDLWSTSMDNTVQEMKATLEEHTTTTNQPERLSLLCLRTIDELRYKI